MATDYPFKLFFPLHMCDNKQHPQLRYNEEMATSRISDFGMNMPLSYQMFSLEP